MPASITLRNGRDVPVAETASEVRDQLIQFDDEDLLALHLDDRGEPGAAVYVRVGEIALVIAT